MKRIIAFLAAAMVVTAFAFAAAAACELPTVELKPGMKVIAALAGPNWAVARVDAIKGAQVMVKFSDGGLGSLGKGEVVAHPSVLHRTGDVPCFQAGARVIAPAQGDTWRFATVLSVTGEKAEVKFADGKKRELKLTELAAQPE